MHELRTRKRVSAFRYWFATAMFLLVPTACGDRDIASVSTAPPPAAQIATVPLSENSTGDRVELLFQNDPDQVTLIDAVIAHASYNLPSSDPATLTTAAATLFDSSAQLVEVPSGDEIRAEIEGCVAPTDALTLADVAVVFATAELPEESPSNLLGPTNALLGASPVDEILCDLPEEATPPLQEGEVPSTVGGNGSVTVSPAGGALETAEDIDTLFDNSPNVLTADLGDAGASVTLTGSIRLPNGSVAVGETFYAVSVNQGAADFSEPVEDVCTPAPVPEGETCAFVDDFAAFPGPFELEFTFTDGAGVDYVTTRNVTIILPE